MEVEWMIVLNDEVGRAAPLFIDELLVALMTPRRRVSFLLGGVVSSSMPKGSTRVLK
jgi:hypothetical protein